MVVSTLTTGQRTLVAGVLSLWVKQRVNGFPNDGAYGKKCRPVTYGRGLSRFGDMKCAVEGMLRKIRENGVAARAATPYAENSALNSRLHSTQTNMQFFQLLLIHLGRRLSQQALRALRFGESNHIANGFGTSHHRDQTIEAERETTVRWRAVL